MTELPTRRIRAGRPAALDAAQLALAWRLNPQTMQRVGVMISAGSVSGPRYSAATQAEIDTEDLAARVASNQMVQ